MSSKRNPDNYVINYTVLRRAIGILGIALPIVLLVGSYTIFECDKIFHSISYYYHTGMRNVLVAIIAILAFFLYSYKGPDPIDLIMSRIAALLAICVALFPTGGHKVISQVVDDRYAGGSEQIVAEFTSCERVALFDNSYFQLVHLIAAALFLLVLAYMSWFLFTKTDPTKPMTTAKRKRNRVYKICAVLIFLCVLACAIIFLAFPNFVESGKAPIFWLEALALWAFGFSWLTKGEAFLSD